MSASVSGSLGNLDRLIARLTSEVSSQAVVLIQGDLVLAEPAAERIAQALAAKSGCAVESHRHPPTLLPLLDDLRTFSLFASGKVVLAIDTAVLADRAAAAALIDDAREVLPFEGAGRALSGRERQAAVRLLQALRLFDLDPSFGDAARLVSQLPAWVFEGASGKRKAAKKGVDDVRAELAALLEAARTEDIVGHGEGDLSALTDAVRQGLPPGHAIVLAERTAAKDHPLVELLQEKGVFLAVGEVEAERGGWQGLDLLAEELARQTGVKIGSDAMAELARRTLRQGTDKKSEGSAEFSSSSRLAGEYRKLATLARGEAGPGQPARIDKKLVEANVEDRGEEDVWQILDAIGHGRGGEALDRLARYLGSAEDPTAARLSFFGLLASFCRQLTAVVGLVQLGRLPKAESSYPRFKDKIAPSLQGEIPGGGKNPLAGLHPFRLHRAYLAAARFSSEAAAHLPADVLETELRLKGESREADAALAQLIAKLTAPRR